MALLGRPHLVGRLAPGVDGAQRVPAGAQLQAEVGEGLGEGGLQDEAPEAPLLLGRVAQALEHPEDLAQLVGDAARDAHPDRDGTERLLDVRNEVGAAARTTSVGLTNTSPTKGCTA